MNPTYLRKFRFALSLFVTAIVSFTAWTYYQRLKFRGEQPVAVELLTGDVLKSTRQLEYSETLGDKVIFKISAEKYIQTVNKMNLLEGIKAVNFGRDNSRHDTIESRRCRYDPAEQTVVFQGGVKVRTQEGAEIVTDSLAYSKNTETAETTEKFSFRRGGFAGEGRGFAYHFREGQIQIQGGAEFYIQSESATGAGKTEKPARIRSKQAIFHRDYQFYFNNGAEILHGDTRMAADQIQIMLDEESSNLRSLVGRQNALLDLSMQDGLGQVGGNLIVLQFSEEANNLKSVAAENQAFFKVRDTPNVELMLTASKIEMAIGENGNLEVMTASDDAELFRTASGSLLWLQGGGMTAQFFPGKAKPRELHFEKPTRLRLAQGKDLLELWAARLMAAFQETSAIQAFDNLRAEEASVWQSGLSTEEALSIEALRILHYEHDNEFQSKSLNVNFDNTGKHPEVMHGKGGCRFQSRLQQATPSGTQSGIRTITAGSMTMHFASQSSSFKSLEAEPEVVVVEELGTRLRKSSCDMVTAEFDLKTREIARALMSGSFVFEQEDMRAGSAEARYERKADSLLLSGDPRIRDQQSETSAVKLEILNQSNEMRATGRVRCLFKNTSDIGLFRTPASDAALERHPPGVFIITSDAMTSNRILRTARYTGSVKASQGESYVKADEIGLDQNADALIADGNVETYFINMRPEGASDARQVRTSSRHMSFIRNANRIEYLDNVALISDQLKLAASRMVVELDSERQQPSKVSAWGSVQIVRGPWYGKGEEGEYRVQENILVLSGRLAEVWDVNKRRSTGRRLTIHIPDDRLVVES